MTLARLRVATISLPEEWERNRTKLASPPTAMSAGAICSQHAQQ